MASQHNLEPVWVSQEWNLWEFLVVADFIGKGEKWRAMVILQDRSRLVGHLELGNGSWRDCIVVSMNSFLLGLNMTQTIIFFKLLCGSTS